MDQAQFTTLKQITATHISATESDLETIENRKKLLDLYYGVHESPPPPVSSSGVTKLLHSTPIPASSVAPAAVSRTGGRKKRAVYTDVQKSPEKKRPRLADTPTTSTITATSLELNGKTTQPNCVSLCFYVYKHIVFGFSTHPLKAYDSRKFYFFPFYISCRF